MNIQAKDAEQLRKLWGNKHCSHPQLAQEHDDSGSHTGDHVCTTCGETNHPTVWDKIREEHARKQKE